MGMNSMTQTVTNMFKSRKYKSLYKSLSAEIQSGKSVVIFNGAGGIQRVVAVATLKLLHRGRFFVEIGKMTDDGPHATCNLPGAKLKEEEMPGDVLPQVIRENLSPFADIITMSRLSQTEEVAVSETFDIQTRYIFSTQEAQLNCDEMPVIDIVNVQSVGGDEPHPDHAVYAVRGKDMRFYAWLNDEEFEHFRQPQGRETLTSWV